MDFAIPLAIGLVIDVLLAAFVWLDAKNQGDEGAGSWAVSTFLLLIIVLPLYIIFRIAGRIGVECPSCHWKTSTQFAKCRHCGSTLTPSAKSKDDWYEQQYGTKKTETEIETAKPAEQAEAVTPKLEPSMMFCRECGAKIKRSSKFCGNCGSAQS